MLVKGGKIIIHHEKINLAYLHNYHKITYEHVPPLGKFY